jgi:O-antigen/teichoic acid export membrane protein
MDSGSDATVVARAPKALALSFLNGIGLKFGTVGIGIALARLLGPHQFGTYAVALLWLMAALSFNDLGVSLAIVRWPEEPTAIAPTVNTISLLASGIVAAAGFLLAPAFAAAMGQPAATGVTRLMCVAVLISGAVSTPAELMLRQFMQSKRLVVDQVNVWVGAVTSLLLALAGMGAMSLALGRVIGSGAAMILFLRFSPQPFRFGLDRRYVRPLLHFGLPLAGASIIVFVAGFADQLVVGGVLGASALGYYTLAFNLSSWPRDAFSLPLRNIAPATFARLQHDPEAMRTAFRAVLGLLAAVTLPICLLLAGAAGPLIRFVYGQAWAPAAAALVWLGMFAAFRIAFELAYDYLVVVGVSRSILGLQVLTLAALIPALVEGARHWGIEGVAAAQVVVAVVVVVPIYGMLFRRVGLPARKLVERLWVPLLSGAGVGASAFGLGEALRSSNLGACALAGLIALLVLAGLLYRDRTELSRLRGAALASAATPAEVAA